MASVVVQDASGLALALSLSSPSTIGRDPQCELALADAKVSRQHARFEERGGAWWLVDLGSRHGTYVNGQRVEEHALVGGDRVQVGSSTMIFEVARREPEIAHRTPSAAGTMGAAGAAAAAGAAGTMGAAAAAGETGGPDERDSGVRAAARHSLLYRFAEAAQQLDDLDAMLASVLQAAVGTFNAARGVVALASSPGGGIRRIAQVRGNDAVIAASILEAVLRRGESVLVTEVAPGTTLEAQGVRAAMAAPLRAGERVLGFLYVDDVTEPRGERPGARGERRAFDAEDLETLSALATLVGALVDGAVRYDRAAVAAEVAKQAAPLPPLLGTSPPMLALRRDIERLAPTALALHLHGESGSGKELVARAVHAASPRAAAPLVAVNCAALPDSLIESELFGHARGAFTGALQPRRGKLALADGGTLFLDEIAELSAAAQAKILRVLEDGEVIPVGAERGVVVDVRVLSASHKDLREEVRAGRFREDLFYRLVVAELEVPPLRSRGEDIARLAEAFLVAARAKGARARGFSAAATAALLAHDWPGNVRELRNVVERGAALAVGAMIEAEDLRLRPAARAAGLGAASSAAASSAATSSGGASASTSSGAPTSSGASTSSGAPTSSGASTGSGASSEVLGSVAARSLADRFALLDVTERELVELALASAQGNVSEAARQLGISRIKIKRRIDRYRLGPSEGSEGGRGDDRDDGDDR